MGRRIEISAELFYLLVRYHIDGERGDEDKIAEELQRKYDRILQHNRYTAYKTIDDPEIKDLARNSYLDAAGYLPDHRW